MADEAESGGPAEGVESDDAADVERDGDHEEPRPDEDREEPRSDGDPGTDEAVEGDDDAGADEEASGDEGADRGDESDGGPGEESAGDGGEVDGEGEGGYTFTADDLVAGGEYIGNDDGGTGDDGDADDAGDGTDDDGGTDDDSGGTEDDGTRTDDGGDAESDEAVDVDAGDGQLVDRPRPEPVEPAAGADADGETFTSESGDGGFGEDPGRPDTEAYERPDNMAETTPIERKTGPVEDEEMPLADHIEEMVARLFVIIAIAGVVSVAVFPFGEELIEIMWYQVLPGGDVARPRVYHPLALVITQLKVASLGGLIVALPVFVYQTYAFMRPGLYPHERRYYLAAVPTSLVLAFVGVTFAYFIVLPFIFTYFLYYTDQVASIAFALSQTFNLILLLMGYLAIVFQIPLFIMLAIMMGLVTRRWLETRRLYFWAGFAGLAFLFSPDPTGMAPFIVAVTMIVLFEGTLLLLRWTGR